MNILCYCRLSIVFQHATPWFSKETVVKRGHSIFQETIYIVFKLHLIYNAALEFNNNFLSPTEAQSQKTTLNSMLEH